MAQPSGAVVASFNLHYGTDGWGRPYDALGACLALEADVLMLEEVLTPAEGPSLARSLVEQGGYALAGEAELAFARLIEPPELRGKRAERWGPGGGGSPCLYLTSPPGHRQRRQPRQLRRAERTRGGWGVALLSRLPVSAAKVVPLTPLPRDPVERVALVAELELAGGAGLHVVGTHFPHLEHGSPLRIGELRRLLGPAEQPGVLLGDMNCFGPPLSLALPGWRRAVRGPSWPAWRPVFQPDHVMVSKGVREAHGEVVPLAGSDHLPVRARLSL